MTSPWDAAQSPQQSGGASIDPYGSPAPTYGTPAPPYGSPASPYGTPAPPYGSQPYGAQPYGAQPYGAQPYGAQPYGAQPYYGTQPGYYGTRSTSTNGFAIAALVAGVLGVSLFAIIFGHVSMSQINRTGEQGKGMAIAGLIIGYVGMLIGIIVFLAIIADPNTYYTY